MRRLNQFIFTLILAVVSSGHLFGQDEDQSIDSLKSIINNNHLHDTVRLKACADIVNYLDLGSERDSYVDILGKISKEKYKQSTGELKKNYAAYLASYYNELASQYNEIGIKKALEYSQKAIELCRTLDNEYDLNFSLIGRGILFYQAGDYNEAINHYFQALRYFENAKKKDLDAISYVYANISTAYDSQQDYETSIKYLNKSLFYLNKKMNADKSLMYGDLIQKCAYLMNLGTAYQKLYKYDNAEKYYKQAEQIANQMEDDSYESIAIVKQGILNYEQQKLQPAKELLERAYELANDELSKGFSSIHLGRVLYLQKNNSEALKHVLFGAEIVEQIQRIDLQQEAYELLFQINKELGNYESSLEYFERFQTLKDSVESKETSHLLRNRELEYEYEKKELALKLKTEKENARKNYFLFGLGTLLLIIIIVSYFLYRNYKHKQAITSYEKRDLNQKLLLSQMNPHFIFNSVDNIQSLIHLNQTDEAIFYLSKFARLTRQVLENSRENYIEFSEEIAMIDNYLNIQKLLYNNTFDFHIQLDDSIETENTFVPPMLVQPFIENAIKHGVANMNNGIIRVLFKAVGKKIIVEISDNGAGLTTEQTLKNHKSMSTKITKERLELLNLTDNVEIHYEDNHPGTKIWFEVPYLYEE